MPDKRKARQSWKSGRASVYEDDRSIALLLVLYALWEAVA